MNVVSLAGTSAFRPELVPSGFALRASPVFSCTVPSVAPEPLMARSWLPPTKTDAVAPTPTATRNSKSAPATYARYLSGGERSLKRPMFGPIGTPFLFALMQGVYPPLHTANQPVLRSAPQLGSSPRTARLPVPRFIQRSAWRGYSPKLTCR